MALLTKAERKNLSKEEKKQLRAKLRAERPKKGLRININWDGLMKSAEEMILDVAGDLVPGEEKMKDVCRQLAKEADDFLTWRGLGVFGAFLEMIDGPVISALFALLIQPQVQKVYDRMKAEGRV